MVVLSEYNHLQNKVEHAARPTCKVLRKGNVRGWSLGVWYLKPLRHICESRILDWWPNRIYQIHAQSLNSILHSILEYRL